MTCLPFLPNIELLFLEDIKEEISTLARLGTLLGTILMPVSLIRKCYFEEVSMNDTAAILFSSGARTHPKGLSYLTAI